jgi:RNA polymerase sigma factor (TIGR02999 family)
MSNVTHILEAIQRGDSKAAEELLPLVYEELRKLAVVRMANEKPGQTLQPTALVHEAWLRLASDQQQWRGRSHFFGAAKEVGQRVSPVRGGQPGRTALLYPQPQFGRSTRDVHRHLRYAR